MAKQQRPVPRAKTPPSRRPGGKPTSRIAPPKPATLGTWIAGARPQTLALAVSPVALGVATASLTGLMTNWWDHWVRALLALAVAVALQIGVNYANDYSDGVRGVDRDRVGPARLVGSGRAKPRTVLTVALVFFGLAAVAGVILVVVSEQWWLLAVGVVAIAAAWFYTGGRRPYGYLGLGELAVFVFFGIVPVVGTTLTQVGTIPLESWLAAVAAGAFASAVLMANNARDRERDKLHGKRTLAVLVGNVVGRVVYAILIVVPFVLLVYFALLYEPSTGGGYAPFVYFAAVAAVPAVLIASTAKTAREWVLVLQLTLLTALLYGVGLAAALVAP